MGNNLDLFQEEIKEIEEFSDLNKSTFGRILNATRGFLENYAGNIEPITVLDILENATNIYSLSNSQKHEISVNQAIQLAADTCGVDDFRNMVREFNSLNAEEYEGNTLKK